MGKLLDDLIRIRKLFQRYGVHDTDKTYGNILKFLEAFANARRDMKYYPEQEKKTDAWESAPDLFRAMLGPDPIPEEKISAFIEDMMAGGYLDDIIRKTLEEVLEFSSEGEDYYKILKVYFLGDKTYKGIAADLKIGMSHSTIQRRKVPAVKLFGVLFWKNLTSDWENCDEEMQRIEREEGRDGFLSDRRKEIFERRSNQSDRRQGDRRKGDRRVMNDRRRSNPGFV